MLMRIAGAPVVVSGLHVKIVKSAAHQEPRAPFADPADLYVNYVVHDNTDHLPRTNDDDTKNAFFFIVLEKPHKNCRTHHRHANWLLSIKHTVRIDWAGWIDMHRPVRCGNEIQTVLQHNPRRCSNCTWSAYLKSNTRRPVSVRRLVAKWRGKDQTGKLINVCAGRKSITEPELFIQTK